jgi:hypothetical protein
MKAPRNRLAAADDAQRMLLCCILRDAVEWDYRITRACPACQAAGVTCAAHWDEHERRRGEYRALRDHLERYEGLAGACPLTVSQQRTLAAAVVVAIAYRRGRGAAEDAALLSAYRSLHRRLPAARLVVGGAASVSLATGVRPSCLAAGITTAPRP